MKQTHVALTIIFEPQKGERVENEDKEIKRALFERLDQMRNVLPKQDDMSLDYSAKPIASTKNEKSKADVLSSDTVNVLISFVTLTIPLILKAIAPIVDSLCKRKAEENKNAFVTMKDVCGGELRIPTGLPEKERNIYIEGFLKGCQKATNNLEYTFHVSHR